jgi:glycosyltransferase involved in cell wall biosynthesis
MRLLLTSEFYAPSVGGAQEVTRQVAERLAARGHDVTVATTALPERTDPVINGVHVAGFHVAGNGRLGVTGEVERYRRFVRDGGFDLVFNYAAQQWTTDALLPVLQEIPARKILAPCGFSGLPDPGWHDYFSRLPSLLAGYDHLVLHSEGYRDAQFLRRHGIDAWSVIANGADEREFSNLPARGTARDWLGLPSHEPVLLTVGSHTGQKGHLESIGAVRALATAKATLLLVGNTVHGRGCLWSCRARSAELRIRSRGRKRVMIRDLDREHRLRAFAAADLFVFASNIECSPLVLFESVAAGLPFVSADVGNAGEIASWTNGGEVVPSNVDESALVRLDPLELAVRVDALLAEPERMRRMGRAGREVWQSRYTWEALSRDYEELFARIVREESASTRSTIARSE